VIKTDERQRQEFKALADITCQHPMLASTRDLLRNGKQ
jgi:hypothetical protein